jgi:hypothetical protein
MRSSSMPSSACKAAQRIVAVAPVLATQPGVPAAAAAIFRTALDGAGIGLVVLEDGVARSQPGPARRASAYYDALRVTPGDGTPLTVWANVEAFDCEGDAGCDRTHPTVSTRFDNRVCAARTRVDGIVTNEYLHHLAGRPLFTADLDASAPSAPSADAASEASSPVAELRAIVDDSDAAAQLRQGYLTWLDAGASCIAAAADDADAEARADAAH